MLKVGREISPKGAMIITGIESKETKKAYVTGLMDVLAVIIYLSTRTTKAFKN